MNTSINIYEIYDYYTIPFWQTTWFFVLVCIAGITLAVYVIFKMYYKKPHLTPSQKALIALDRLSQMPLVSSQDGKKIYFELTAILKQFLHQQYRWNILDKTDEELALWLEKQGYDPQITTILKNLANSALWVKFANAQALKTQIDSDISNVRIMITQTTDKSTPT